MGFFDAFFGGGGGGAAAAEKAASVQAQAAMQAAAIQQQMYQQARADVAPWREAGGAGVKQIGGLMGLPGYTALDPTSVLQATPGYQWGLGQGLGALQRYGASTGLGQSGAALKGATQFGTNYATQQAWNPYMANLQNLSGQGLQAGGMSGNWGMQAGQMIGQDYMSAAQAQAQGIMQAYNAQQMGNANMMSGLGMLGGLGMSVFGGGGLGSFFGGGGNNWGAVDQFF